MWQYIKNILPRIEQFSAQLDVVENFVDKPWILIDEEYNTHEYIFLRDHRLILSRNGRVINGTWELLPTGKLLINRVKDEVLLQHSYLDAGILIMQISGGKDLPFMLINETVITDRDPLNYLKKVEAVKLNYTYYKTENGTTINNSNSNTGQFEVGNTVTYDDEKFVNGEIQSFADPEIRFMVEDGLIKESYFIREYETTYGIMMRVKKSRKEYILKNGDIIVNHRELPSKVHENAIKNNLYKRITTDENGVVIEVKLKSDGSSELLAFF